MDKLYAFVMKGELTKVALNKTEVISKHSHSDIIEEDYIKSLSLDLLDEEYVNAAKVMATVYTAIAAFENTVREFVMTVLMENFGENWWEQSVSSGIRKKAESRKKEEDKIKWHTHRGDSLINYTEFGDLASVMSSNYEIFSPYIISVEWARNIITTIERSRNVIMHSGELSARDVERIGINIRDWISQVGV